MGGDYSNGGKLMWLDYVIFLATIVISLGIGLYQARGKQRTTSTFLMAGQKTPSFPGGNVAHCVNCVCGYPAGQRLGTPLFWNQLHILHRRKDLFVHRGRMCDRTLTLPFEINQHQ